MPKSYPKCRASTVIRLSTPKERNPYCIPDRPSVYWLDYLENPKPHSITNAYELLEYYQKYYEKHPRLELLSQPKRFSKCREPRPLAEDVPNSALSYNPSERIKQLAQPKIRIEDDANKLPPIATQSRHSSRPDGWNWKNIPKTAVQKAKDDIRQSKSQQQTSVDLSKGDFHVRSRFSMTNSNSKLSGTQTSLSKTKKPFSDTAMTTPKTIFKVSRSETAYKKEENRGDRQKGSITMKRNPHFIRLPLINQPNVGESQSR